MNNFTASETTDSLSGQKARVMENLGRCIGIADVPRAVCAADGDPSAFPCSAERSHRRQCFCE